MCTHTHTHTRMCLPLPLSKISQAHIRAASAYQDVLILRSCKHGRVQRGGTWAQLRHRLSFCLWGGDISLSEPQFPFLLNGTNQLPLKGECQRHVKFCMQSRWLGPDLFIVSSFLPLGVRMKPHLLQGPYQCLPFWSTRVSWQRQDLRGIVFWAGRDKGLDAHTLQGLFAQPV